MTPYASGKRWRLFHGDCLDVLAAGLIPADAAIVSDVPYGMGWDHDSTRFSGGTDPEMRRGGGRLDWAPIVGDDAPFDPAPWLGFPRVALFGFNHFAARLPVGTTLVWIKRTDSHFGTFLSDAELVWVKGGHGVYCYQQPFPPGRKSVEAAWSRPVSGGSPAHPCQKPEGLMEWVIERARVPASALVCDPYAGSCSTGVAALRSGRPFIGCEIEPAYLDIAVRRLSQAEHDGVPLPLFGASP